MTLLSSHLKDEYSGASWETKYTRRAQDAKTHSKLDNSFGNDGTTASILPKRLIAVFGMESSGSTFTATTIGIAAGVTSPEKPLYIRSTDSERNIEVQHISLPTGYGAHGDSCMSINGEPTKDMPVLLPEPCMVVPPRYKDERFARDILLAERPFPEACRLEAGVNDFVVYPTRFFINVTSHIQWYRERGVEATAVIMMRDSSISQISKVRSRCPNKNVAEEQNEHARQLMREAIDKLNPSSEIVLVSYEGLISLRESYLYDIYRRLGINSTYAPSFQDANAKYIDASAKVERRLFPFPGSLASHVSRVVAPVTRQNTTSTSMRLL